MTDMKTLIIDGVEYEVVDESVRSRMTDAEGDISDLQTGKADAEDVPSNTSDLTNDAGFITEVPVEDVRIEGTSIVQSKRAEIPMATGSQAGVLMFDPVTELQRADIYAGDDAMYPHRVPLLNENQQILADQLPAATQSTKGAMSAADKAKLDGILNAVYPVGSIYMSVNPTDPTELFGGTWEVWGTGRVPVGVDASDSSFNTAEKTGGNTHHALTTDELPAHTHPGYNGSRFVSFEGDEGGSSYQMATGSSGRYVDTAPQGGRFHHYAVTGNAGGGAPHNNLQPYITCYMWKRTA